MVDLIVSLFEKFAYITGIIGEVREYKEVGIITILIIGAILLTVGFKMYRMFFSVFVFIITTLTICLFVEPRLGWGASAAYFSVVGIIFAAISYRWNKTAAVVFCMIMSALISFLFSSNYIITIISAILGGFIGMLFPFYGICLGSSAVGTFILCDIINHSYITILTVLVVAVGMRLQIYINRNQNLLKNFGLENLRIGYENRKGH